MYAVYSMECIRFDARRLDGVSLYTVEFTVLERQSRWRFKRGEADWSEQRNGVGVGVGIPSTGVPPTDLN